MHVITTASHKGGTGKTTTTAGLACALAQLGKTVMVIDMDPQGGITAALGAPDKGPGSRSLIMGPSRALEVAEATEWNVSVVPADLRLATAEIELPARDSRWRDVLRRRLRDDLGLSETIDVVLIDTPPGLGVLSYIALRAADRVLITCPRDFLAVRVVPHMIETAKGAGIEVGGIIPTMVERRSLHDRQAGEILAANHGPLLLPEIPRRVALRDAAGVGRPIQHFAPRSDATRAFQALAEEVTNAITR